MLSQKQHKDTLTSLKLLSLCDFSDHPTQILSHALPALQKAKGEHLGVSRGMIFKLVDGLHLFYYFQFGDAIITLHNTIDWLSQQESSITNIHSLSTLFQSSKHLSTRVLRYLKQKRLPLAIQTTNSFFSSIIFPSWKH